ncbi:NADPH-dependent FMN reductase [Desulfovibrio cuneatus]|uniref:NADPH-dependent FMN reductase n=1 Tax=Desulfovibrio cuneatus TaxID=159728 RepID=UPI00041F8565|nr:NAD(P)H-dependent oxidoreductase [Desulfovibrio cuneatus]
MKTPIHVAVLVGSLRKEAYSLKTAKALIAAAPKEYTFDIVPIGQLPLYNEDLDTAEPPATWAEFRKRIGKADALLFVTPEYNRSLPAALKNALDVGSRPYGQNMFSGKPGAVVSISIGAIGGFGANHHLRQSLVFLNVPLMQQPEVYIGEIQNRFTPEGQPQEAFSQYLGTVMQACVQWVGTILKK